MFRRICAEARESMTRLNLVILVVAVCVAHSKSDNDEEVVRFTVDPAGATTHHTAKLVLRVTPSFVFVIPFVHVSFHKSGQS